MQTSEAIDRRLFLKILGAAGFAPIMGTSGDALKPALPKRPYKPGRILNEYSLFLPGELEALSKPPAMHELPDGSLQAEHDGAKQQIAPGQSIGGWRLLVTAGFNGVRTAVFEKQASHRGAIAYVTQEGGVIALVPTQIGALDNIRPRPVSNNHGIRLSRAQVPGPDIAGDYILNSEEDPGYENVAALGPEYIGWSLAANEETGSLRSVFLEASGRSRQPEKNAQEQFAPDLEGPLFDPVSFFPFADPDAYSYKDGWSKRTLLGGFLPVPDTGVWNPDRKAGYRITMLLPPGVDAQPMARVRMQGPVAAGKPAASDDHYWHCSAAEFYENLLGIWNKWNHFYEDSMSVDIPDTWLLDSARAGVTLSRCSYRGLHPTYQVGEGGYTKIPERSHALFPVAAYEFIWAHQLWNLTEESDPYFQFYLDNYILEDGNFLYNTQDQVEGPMNNGYFLMNSARAYWYTGNGEAFLKRLPVLERILGFVLARYAYGKEHYPKPDRRYGLIWGSPEADLGAPNNDFPNAHPFYYQNAAAVWRGLHEHARVLTHFAAERNDAELTASAKRYAALAAEMRENIRVSIEATIAAGDPAMRRAGITPFTTYDIHHKPGELSSYENHRFMMDWFLADWGDPALDLGYLKHRRLAGEQICGMNTDGDAPRVSNFMSHGTLAVLIRQEDYRPFLLTLYGLACYAADSGNRYAPEDAYVPGSYPGEGSKYGWSAVINSTLQTTLGLRWLLCYEESDKDICHLQKAAPKDWFNPGERIAVRNCPTRWGRVSWATEAKAGSGWEISVTVPRGFMAQVVVHLHTPDGARLQSASVGSVAADRIILAPGLFSGTQTLKFTVT